MATSWTGAAIVLIGCCAATSCATFGRPSTNWTSDSSRVNVIARSQVWMPTNVGTMNLKTGPTGTGAFAPGATVSCSYVERKLSGRSPKFLCDVGRHDTVMVKYGQRNGEVYGEVLGTRLLWALGFAADSAYPVTVICRGCPEDVVKSSDSPGEARFDPATIKRRKTGQEWKSGDHQGWAWEELDRIDAEAGGASLAQRDALKLLAVLMQHTDSKAEQQRILCLGPRSAACRRPLLMVSDVGLTFGSATFMNDSNIGSVSLTDWRGTHVWKHDTGCEGNLPRSFTGTLANPTVSEDGRRFLSRLLAQLSDRQLRDLFEVSRVTLRARFPRDPSSRPGTIEEWVDAFKEKRQEIAERRCS